MAKEINSIIEITDTHVKLVQARTLRGQRVLTACELKRLTQFTDQEIAGIIAGMVRSQNIRIDELLLVIPRHLSILKQMRLPSQRNEELNKMVGLHLTNQIPYTPEEVVVDYQPIDKESGGYTKVLAIIVHKDVSQRYIKIFKNAGLFLNRLTLSSLGVLEWWNHQAQKGGLDASRAAAVIDVDWTRAEICFIRTGQLFFSRSLPYGARDLSPDVPPDLIEQIKLSLQTYRKENMGPDIQRLVIVCALRESQALKEKLEKAFQLPVEIRTSFDHASSVKNANLAALKTEPGVSLMAALGLLLSVPKNIINLTPAEVHQTAAADLQKKQWLTTGALAAVTAVMLLAVIGAKIYQKNDLVSRIDAELKKTGPQAKLAQQRIDNIHFLTELAADKLKVADIVSALFALTPAEIAFRSVAIDRNGQLIIEGYGQNNAGIQNFRTRLIGSTLFKDSTLQSSTERKIYNMDVVEFRIVSRLSKETANP